MSSTRRTCAQRGFLGLITLAVAGWVLLPVSAAQSVPEGIDQFQKGNFAEAKRLFEEVLRNDDKNAEAHYRLGLILLRPAFRDEDGAVEHMERAVMLNAGNADYHYGLGAAYGMKAQSAGTIRKAFLAPKVKGAFEKAIAIDPNHLQARVGLAQYYRQAPGIMGGSMEKAWREADILIGLDEVLGRSFKSGLYESEKNLAEAERELATLTANRPDDWRSWRGLGNFYLRNQRADDALAAFGKYEQLRPDTAEVYERIAAAMIQKKEGDRALAHARKALAIDGDYGLAKYRLGQAYELKGMKKEAREAFQAVLVVPVPTQLRTAAEKKIKELE